MRVNSLRDDRNRALGIVGLAAVILAMHACTGTDEMGYLVRTSNA